MRLIATLTLATATLALPACTSSRPILADIPPASQRAGRVEAFPLVEYRHGFLGSTEARSEGILEVAPDFVVWTVGGSDVLGLRADVIREVWLNCARRPAENLCLEIGLRTLTGDTYHFRDRDWRAGGNRQTLALYDHLQANYRGARFSRRNVSAVR